MEKPFFIVSPSRSGSTMLRLMLNMHSRLAVPHEMKYFGLAVPEQHLRTWRTPSISRDRFESLISAWIHSRSHSFADIGIQNVLDTAIDRARTFRDPYESAMNMWAEHQGKQRWGEKTPNNIFYVDILADMFPNSQFIFLVRDPRAVVRSMKKSSFFSTNCVINSYNWKASISSGVKLLKENVHDENKLVVRYEDLVQDTEEVLKRVVSFLGEPFESDMLRFHEIDESLLPQKVRTPNIKKPVDSSTAHKWKHDLSESEIAIVDWLCSDFMRKFGYSKTDHSPNVQDYLYILSYTIYWIWKRSRYEHPHAYTMKHQPPQGMKSLLRLV